MLHIVLQTEAIAEASSSISLLSMAAKGGWLMLVLLALSIMAVYIFGERMVVLRKAAKVDENFMNNIKEYIYDGKVQSAIHLCESKNTLTARLIRKGLQNIGRPLTDIKSAIENVGSIEVARLEKGLPVLASIAGGAPMVGFLGTVLGMIKAFYNMSMAGNNIDITLLSEGIYIAMVTTVGGLIIGIPAYFAYNYLATRIGSIVNTMEKDTLDFLDLLQEPLK
ncbi:MAG: MotA/TolQ/ExbB proton channel family protein [Bacteroidales bacterium]|jgi:biopolymer transport protein ExbB|nr:MotA/TolQ/ExbB proton channel family protein [Bacteroidales bacterium]NLK80471.1 MotA/TolQ/ExbB proton channel family protein [Bacteroidales bacterium]HKM31477.1 MotA/TolQ/ExbB proton channel family protein [Bacteroidales bacterium]HPX78847.1 MotA/TolQ/ExbB proton channel family protein [Bacteroidales bacterium]HQB22834.1 MotA/TolQ/ExbB proton channel family protein [Bacteroidales bacterium]